MLTLKQIKLKNDMLLLEQYEVEVPSVVSGITRDPEEVKREKETRRFRIGKVIAMGIINNDAINSIKQSLLKANITEQDESSNKELLLNNNLLFDASSIDLFDIPVEGYKPGTLILVNVHYIYGEIVEEIID